MKKIFSWIVLGILILASSACKREGVEVPDEVLAGLHKPVICGISPAGILFNNAGFSLRVDGLFEGPACVLYINDRQIGQAGPNLGRAHLDWSIPKALLSELLAASPGGVIVDVRVTGINATYDISGDFEKYRNYVSEPVALEIKKGETQFSAPKNLFPQWKNSSDPVIRCDKHGNLYLAWIETVGDISQAFFSFSSDGGSTWSQVLNISRSADNVSELDLGVDDSGHFYMVWQEDYGESSSIIFSRSLDGGSSWLLPKKMKATGNIPNTPVLNINDRGDVSIAWNQQEHSAGTELCLAVSRDFGKNWDMHDFAVPKSSFTNGQPILISGPGGIVYLLSACFSSTTGFYFFSSRDYWANWQVREVQTNTTYPVTGFTRARACLGPENQVYFVWGDIFSGEHEGVNGNYFLRVENSGDTWSEIQFFQEICCMTSGVKTALSVSAEKVDVVLPQAGGLFLLRSIDGGRTWPYPEFIPGTDCLRCVNSPDMVLHPSGKNFLVFTTSASFGESALYLMSFE